MASDDHPMPERREITVRRAPKYVPFLILGGIVGIAAAAVIAYALPGDPSYDRGAVFGFFMVLCGAGGVILGAIAALVLDRLSVKRARHAVVEAAPEADQALPDAERDTSRDRTRDDNGEPGLRS
ncbi:hypothetical protein [Arthrobacter sp. ISL-5]|uniref:hypothetical protein n=1 Tax=Arthrobacter sp. ISL-5 TaxID=2819111 RepID=UPI001BE88966|nr:hypothetical protein [Arthrobacter sp. ISL-5]MBT2553359.1 hypothetical protein [Arthrobacter sp. ISL-5]